MQTQNQANATEQSSEVRIAPTAQAMAVFESRGFARRDHADQVERIKFLASALMTELDKITVPPGNSESGRLLALAKTELESSVMWGVKAISRFSAPSYLTKQPN